MKKNLVVAALSFALLGGSITTASAAISPYGTWKRPNGSTAKVWACGKKLCAKVVSGKKAGFNMFMSGIDKKEQNVWKGKMKHPKMGTGMTFNGTVKLSGRSLHVKGCMLGGIMCDSEVWKK